MANPSSGFQLLETIPQPVIFTDTSKQIIAVNSAFCREYGYACDSLKGKGLEAILQSESLTTVSFSELLSDADSQPAENRHKAVINGHNGNLYHICVSVVPIYNGQQDPLFALFVSCDTKASLKNVYEDEVAIEIMDIFTDGIVFLKMDGTIIYANSWAMDLFGKSVKNFSDLNILSIITPADPELARLEQTLDIWIGGGIGQEGLIQHDETGEFPVEVKGVMLSTEQHRSAFVCLIIRDLRERKQFEKTLMEREQFETAVQMSIALAHEVNNPLAVIKGSIDMMKMGEYTEEQLSWLEKMDSHVTRIIKIVKDMTELHLIKKRSYTTDLKYIDIHSSAEKDEKE